jgi:hypothetical protein
VNKRKETEIGNYEQEFSEELPWTRIGNVLNQFTTNSPFHTMIPAMLLYCGVSFESAPRSAKLTICLLALALLGGISPCFGQTPKLEASVDSEELFAGEAITYQVEVKNVENPQAPDVTALEELFDVQAAGNASRDQFSTFVIGGRMTQKNIYSHAYYYKLKPKKSGKLTIPAVTTKVDGTVYKSNTVDINIQDIEEQDIVIAQTILDQTKVYPTQTFSVTLRILVKGLPKNTTEPLQPIRRKAPHLQVDWINAIDGLKANDTSEWLGSLLSRSGTGFAINDFSSRSGSLFDSPKSAVFNLLVGREKRKDLTGEEVEYFVYELKRNYTAEKAGAYTFGASMIKGTFVTGLQGREYTARRIVAIAESASLVVKDVPQPRPTGFVGGIGSYQVAASASPSKLRVGDPLTLTLEFERGPNSGSLDLVSAPDLNAMQELVQDFEIVDANPTGRVDGDSKRFGYAIRPKRSGVSVPSLAFATFDPVREEFVEVKTATIPLSVAEASQVQTTDIVGTIASNKSGGGEIRANNKGIFQNINDPALLRDQSVDVDGRLKIVGGTWTATLMATAALMFFRRRSSDLVRQRRIRASRNAMNRLQEAAQSKSDPKLALRGIRTAILGLVADSSNRVAEGMTAADVEQALRSAQVPGSDQSEIMQILNTIESSEYGGAASVNVDEIVRNTRRLISSVAPRLERSNR